MSLGRNTLYNLAGQAAPLVVSLVTVPVYLHLVGIERYGVLAITWMMLGYFGLFDLGLTRATSYRIASQRDEPSLNRARTFWTAVSVSLALAMAGAVLLYAGGHWYFSGPFEVGPELRAEALQALPVLALALPGAIVASVLNGALQGREHFFEVNAIGIVSATLTQLVPVFVAWWFGPHLLGLLAASVAVQFVAIAVLWHRCRHRILDGHRFTASRAEARELLRYGGWITVSSALAPIMVVVDRFVIGSAINAAAVATYSVPAQLAQRASMIPYALATALFPRLSADTDRAKSIELAQTSTRTGMAVLTPVVVVGICAMGPFLTIWLGGRLAPVAALVGQVALLGWWVNGIAINPFALLQASGRPRSTALLHLVELPLYGTLLWVLTGRYGLVGAAAAFTIRCAVDCVALCGLTYRRSPDLLIYLFPAALLLISVPLIGSLRFEPAPIATALALLAAACAWSALVLPRHLRQGLIQILFRKNHARRPA